MNNENVIVRYLKSEERCQVIFDKLIKALDEQYKLFLDRKAPYNKRVKEDHGKYDPNWETFYTKAEEMGQDAVMKMGVRDYDMEYLISDFECAESKSELNGLVKNYKSQFKNKVAPELLNFIYRIRQGWNDKYVYVWNEKSLHTRQSTKSVQEETVSKDAQKFKPYIEEIVAGLTEEALDALFNSDEDALVSDEQLSLLFKPKFKEDEECEYPEANELALRYNKEDGEMMLVLSFVREIVWKVKCDPNDVKSIISSAIECLNHNTEQFI